MKQLVEYVVRGLVAHPDSVHVNAVEGESSLLLELTVDPADAARVHGADGETLRALRTVLSASAGRRRAVLEFVDPEAPGGQWPTEETPTEEIERSASADAQD